MNGEEYDELIEKTATSISKGRDPRLFNARDVALARMFCYAWRSQTIGLFHTIRSRLESLRSTAPSDHTLAETRHTVVLLQQFATWPIPRDFRAALGPLWSYHVLGHRLEQLLAENMSRHPDLSPLCRSLRQLLDDIRTCGGIWVGRCDRVVPERIFQVPGIAVEIQPVVYMEHHSWNVARLGPESVGRTVHKHSRGVEIHLGFSPLHGLTILGDCAAEVEEGYAMPIPVGTPHGFDTLREEIHLLPFIFGSNCYAGWGIFFDVEPVPPPSASLKRVRLNAPEMNGSLYLERELRRLLDHGRPGRFVLCPPERTRSEGIGALELAAVLTENRWHETPDRDVILALWQGRARLETAGSSRALEPGDHVGIPAEVAYELIAQDGPVLCLDARLLDEA